MTATTDTGAASAAPDDAVADVKPPVGTDAWFEWMDRHHPAKPDEWFHARRSRERGQNGPRAGPREWAALAEWRRYRAQVMGGLSPSERRGAS